MGNNGLSMSPARVFFGFAVLVAAFAFLANAISFEVFNTNSFMFVCVGALACCVIACSVEIWKSGFQCLIGNNTANAVHASGFWSCFGTYAWYCGVMGACMCFVAYAGKVNGASSFDNMIVPAMYCMCYGMFFKAVGSSIACACCCSCVPGGVGNAANMNVVSGNVGNVGNATVSSGSANVKESVSV